ncbi:MAG: hypothetical protein SGPRY_008928, partial [Prymnesium sp.]
PSNGVFAALATLRSLGRLVLEHALLLQESARGSSMCRAIPDEIDLIRALSDALVPSVPCFKPHWRAMVRRVLALLADEISSSGGGTSRKKGFTSGLDYELQLLVKKDLELLRSKSSEELDAYVN